MHTSPTIRFMIYFVITLGAILSLACAAVPHFTTGFTLHLGVLFSGLLPYLVYGVFINLVRGGSLLTVGALLLGIDLVVKIPERFLDYDGYANGLIFIAPILTALVLMIVLGILARRDNLWRGIRNHQVPPAKPPGQDATD
ncbi:MAG: hypothetical protein NUV51_07265 [Sulfuricaulis sp.]|nr:hypothetical protein [Sulfuricaulis sp.]